MNLPAGEVSVVKCRQCGADKFVNKVFLPYLDGYVNCFTENCPQKMTEKSEA